MASLIKLNQIISRQSQSIVSNITTPDDLHQMLAKTQHEPRSPTKLAEKHLPRVPTVAEYKAIIHSECPLDDILDKAPKILKSEMAKLIASLPPERKPLSSYVATPKQPSEYRRNNCYSCGILHKSPAQAEVEVEKLELERGSSKMKSKKSVNSSDSVEEDSDDEEVGLNMDLFTLSTYSSGSNKKQVVSKPSWRHIGLNSKRASELNNQATKNILGKLKKTIGKPADQLDKNKNMKNLEKFEEPNHIFTVYGSPISFKGFGFKNFTQWFGKESMINFGSKHITFDTRGYDDNEIELKLHDGNTIDIIANRAGKGPGRLIRKKFIGTFIIPKPDLLEQFQFCRTFTGHLVIQKKSPSRALPAVVAVDEKSTTPLLKMDNQMDAAKTTSTISASTIREEDSDSQAISEFYDSDSGYTSDYSETN